MLVIIQVHTACEIIIGHTYSGLHVSVIWSWIVHIYEVHLDSCTVFFHSMFDMIYTIVFYLFDPCMIDWKGRCDMVVS